MIPGLDLAALAFATPLAGLLLPLPLLAAALLPPAPRAVAALRLPETLLGTEGGGGRRGGGDRRRLPLALAGLAWLLTVVALCGPQTIQPTRALPASGREIMLVLDFSGSMERRDFDLDGARVRRIDALKAVAGEFLARRAGDRVGLVLFAEVPMLASVPTFDLSAVTAVLNQTEIGTLGRSTAIGDGLGLALKQMQGSTATSRVIVLLSDGTGTAGAVPPRAAAALARDLGVRVHTIALGTDDAVADAGAASVVDAATLAAIAAASGGETFRVRTTEDLRAVAAAIETLEASRFTGAAVSVPRELWPFPAAVAVVLLLAGFLADRRRT